MTRIFLILLFLLTTICAFADVRMPAQFSDNMVLQRNIPVPVWGWAKAGEKVTVCVAGKTVRIVADKDGTWQILIPKLRAGGPYKLSVTGDNKIEYKDVLVGEVWICSGQSNMATPLSNAKTAEEAISKANNKQIRLYSTCTRHDRLRR